MDGRNHKIFGRIAVLLLSLADLAERAGGARLIVRCLVLWVLRRAETVVRAYAREYVGSPLPVESRLTDDMSGDDARLARDLRALAAVFRALAHWARLAPEPPGTPRGVIALTRGREGSSPPIALFAPRLDTS